MTLSGQFAGIASEMKGVSSNLSGQFRELADQAAILINGVDVTIHKLDNNGTTSVVRVAKGSLPSSILYPWTGVWATGFIGYSTSRDTYNEAIEPITDDTDLYCFYDGQVTLTYQISGLPQGVTKQVEYGIGQRPTAADVSASDFSFEINDNKRWQLLVKVEDDYVSLSNMPKPPVSGTVLLYLSPKIPVPDYKTSATYPLGWSCGPDLSMRDYYNTYWTSDFTRGNGCNFDFEKSNDSRSYDSITWTLDGSGYGIKGTGVGSALVTARVGDLSRWQLSGWTFIENNSGSTFSAKGYVFNAGTGSLPSNYGGVTATTYTDFFVECLQMSYNKQSKSLTEYFDSPTASTFSTTFYNLGKYNDWYMNSNNHSTSSTSMSNPYSPWNYAGVYVAGYKTTVNFPSGYKYMTWMRLKVKKAFTYTISAPSFSCQVGAFKVMKDGQYTYFYNVYTTTSDRAAAFRQMLVPGML